MNPFEMVVLIVAIVMIAGVLRSRQGSRRLGRNDGEPAENIETLRLREEVKMLKERLHVLERIHPVAHETESEREPGTGPEEYEVSA